MFLIRVAHGRKQTILRSKKKEGFVAFVFWHTALSLCLVLITALAFGVVLALSGVTNIDGEFYGDISITIAKVVSTIVLILWFMRHLLH